MDTGTYGHEFTEVQPLSQNMLICTIALHFVVAIAHSTYPLPRPRPSLYVQATNLCISWCLQSTMLSCIGSSFIRIPKAHRFRKDAGHFPASHVRPDVVVSMRPAKTPFRSGSQPTNVLQTSVDKQHRPNKGQGRVVAISI